MADAFSEFESTDMSSPITQSPKPQAPQVPTDPKSPPPGERIQRISEPYDWGKLARGVFLLALSLLFLILVLLSAWIGYRWGSSLTFERPIPAQSLIPQETSKSVDPGDLKKIEGANTWLRKLLREARRESRVLRENLATAEVRIRNLMEEKTADERYHEFLKYALDQFMGRPFAPGEGSRSICFTTDERSQKCYQIERPKDWHPGDPMPPLRQFLGGLQ